MSNRAWSISCYWCCYWIPDNWSVITWCGCHHHNHSKLNRLYFTLIYKTDILNAINCRTDKCVQFLLYMRPTVVKEDNSVCMDKACIKLTHAAIHIRIFWYTRVCMYWYKAHRSPPTPRFTLLGFWSSRKSAVSLNTATGAACGTSPNIDMMLC